ncbi:LOW QUALITY PROTEIN: protein-glutamine gamma-glutamyltransferase 2-like [Aulostomus maculatus]
MEAVQQTTHINGKDRCRLKLVNFEVRDNHVSHDTEGLSKNYLVVRRGKPFKVTLLFHSCLWDPHQEMLVLEVLLGSMSERIPVKFSDKWSNPQSWSARIYPGNMHHQGVTIHICSPVLSSVALYHLLVHMESIQGRRSYVAGQFVLLCNPWLKEDPVFMPRDVQIQEYIKSDYGLVYMGTHLNVSQRPWSFGQYVPGVLEACLKLLQVSPQHLCNQQRDYLLRADPVYLSRVVCAMVNCNDDMGVLEGRWQGNYKDGVKPTDWSGTADILHRWVSSNCRPVRYGQCWVFASVLCTVMRVLGIPSRVVTVFNAAHDGDSNQTIEELYSSTGEKLGLSNDSIWNFHVWVECWMRRPDLGAGFDGWQVVDPTPQEKSAGIYTCGPCPVVAVQQRCLGAPYDSAFIYASVDADIVRLIVRDGLVVGRTVDTEWVGQLIYTKCIGSDTPENLTQSYKRKDGAQTVMQTMRLCSEPICTYSAAPSCGAAEVRAAPSGSSSSGLVVTLTIEGVPSVGKSINVCVTVTNQSSSSRVLMEHVNAQVKEYNHNPQRSFWKIHKKLQIQPHEVLTLHHAIPPSEYELILSNDDIVKMVVVIKDVRTQERALDTQDVNISSPKISIEIEEGDNIQMKKEYKAQVSFTNTFTRALSGAVLAVEGPGLVQGKHEARLVLLQPGEKIEKKVSVMATSPGTKLLMATFSHSNSSSILSRSFHKVSVVTDGQRRRTE